MFAAINHTHASGGGSGVDSVNTRTGAVTLTKTDVGLANVDNTSDANKPLSTASTTALAGKAATVHTHAESDVTGLTADLAAKAPLASPTFTGVAVIPAMTRTGRTKRSVTALTDAATILVDASLNDNFAVTLTASGHVLGTPSNPPTGTDTQLLMFAITQDGTGNKTMTLAAGYAFGTDITSITLSTAANKTDYLGVRWNPLTSKWDVMAFARGY
jgi:hypothetical protein